MPSSLYTLSFLSQKINDFHFPADERPSCESGASFWLKGNDKEDYGDGDEKWGYRGKLQARSRQRQTKVFPRGLLLSLLPFVPLNFYLEIQ